LEDWYIYIGFERLIESPYLIEFIRNESQTISARNY